MEGDSQKPRESPNDETTSSENKMEYENLERHLSSVMDERDQLKIMLEDIRHQFTAESRLREYLEKMRNTLLKVLSNEEEDERVRIQESLNILSSLNTLPEETLQTTGDFLTDLSYSDQETVYGCVPTSAQRKQALRREASQKALKPRQPHRQLWKDYPHQGAGYSPQPISGRLMKVTIGDTQTEDSKCNSLYFPNFETRLAFDSNLALPAKNSTVESKGGSSKPAIPTDVQSLLTRKPVSRKHNFVLWLGRNPELCSYCRARIQCVDFVRRCDACGMMVHARRCEPEGQCSAHFQ